MPILPGTRVVGFNQITLSGGAVTLGNGAYMVATVAVGNSGGTLYQTGDIVTLAGSSNGFTGQYYVTSVTAGVVTGISLLPPSTPASSGPGESLPGYFVGSGNTPGTTNVATAAAFSGSTGGSGLTLNVTYNSTNPIPPSAKAALIEASIIANVAVLYTADGSTPTTTTGLIINAGNTVLRDDVSPGGGTGRLTKIQLVGATSSAVCAVEFRGA